MKLYLCLCHAEMNGTSGMNQMTSDYSHMDDDNNNDKSGNEWW